MPWPTHDITNQVADLDQVNLYAADPALAEGVRREGAGWHEAALACHGAALGTQETWQLAALANRHAPELHTHDRVGNRTDVVECHPAWHALLAMQRRASLQALPWAEPRGGAHVARTAAYFLQAQAESGSLCPITMTFAAIPLLQREPALFAQLRDKLYARVHDPRDLPIADKQSVMIGMGMTEKQGGSDVRGNTTRAEPLAGAGRGAAYVLTGHKWFYSAPACDAHLVLAQSAGGLSCFFVPRWRPDGSRNAILIQRLKDKLGNRSNASGEVEFQQAYGVMVGDEGRGIPTIIEMAAHTRLDCVIGSAGLMRHALMQALHHARHRSAFGRPLIDQPLMRNVLADLALESEAGTLLMLRLARAADTPDDPLERAWRRIVTPAAKFWVCKRALAYTGECMEVWGGNGYVESGPMPRLYREAPVNSIWEGSGNVMCLDVLRAAERDPAGLALLLDALADAGAGPLAAALRTHFTAPAEQREAQARRIAQLLVLAAQAGLMRQHAPAASADLFMAGLADAQGGRVYGTLPAAGLQAVLERAWPA